MEDWEEVQYGDPDRLRSICFTWNNYDEAAEESVRELSKGCHYMIVGKEVGKKSGIPHLQGYCHFASKIAFKKLKGYLYGANFRKAKGDAQQNWIYCTKDSAPWLEIGEQPRQGARNDLKSMKEAVKSGKSMRTMIEDGSITTFPALKAAPAVFSLFEKKRDWVPEVIWITGPPGCGKSRMAYEMAPDAYTKDIHHKWWDGYDAHEDVIVDDFRDSAMKHLEFIRLLDAYEYRCEIKGGMRQLRARRIIITSIKKPEECYARLAGEPAEQLSRRISRVIDLSPKSGRPEVGGNTKAPTSEDE